MFNHLYQTEHPRVFASLGKVCFLQVFVFTRNSLPEKHRQASKWAAVRKGQLHATWAGTAITFLRVVYSTHTGGGGVGRMRQPQSPEGVLGRCHPCLETLEKRAFLEYGNGRQPLDISSFLNQGVLWAGDPLLARLLTVGGRSTARAEALGGAGALLLLFTFA